MSRFTATAFALVCATMFAFPLTAQSSDTKGGKGMFADQPGYQMENIEGFTVYKSKEAIRQDGLSELERKPLSALRRELAIVNAVLPDKILKSLKNAVPIWVEWDEKLNMGNGRPGQAIAVFYGGPQENLLRKGNLAVKAKAVTILSLRALADEHQPEEDSGRCVTLHELAHAVHYHLIGDGNPDVTKAFDDARVRNLYDPEMYAATNRHEYFAELTCAYFDQLDYYPRNREELFKRDPEGHKLMVSIWGKNVEKKIPPQIQLLPALAWIKVIEKKDTAAMRLSKIPSANGKGKYSLKLTTEDLKPGASLFGELPKREDWKGRPILVLMFPANYDPAFYMFEFVNAWHAELKDFGLITFGVEVANVTKEALAKVIRQREVKFPFVSDTDFGAEERYRPPHAVVYDHSGKCIFRGTPLDAERYVRIAVGKSILARAENAKFGKQTQEVADLLARGAPMKSVLAKLAELPTSAASAAGRSDLEAAITAHGFTVLRLASSVVEKDQLAAYREAVRLGSAGRPRLVRDQLDAYFEAARLKANFFGTRLAVAADNLAKKVKDIGSETRASLETEFNAQSALIKLQNEFDKGFSKSEYHFDPKSDKFKKENSDRLLKFAKELARFRTKFGKTRAWDDAERFAERWIVEGEEKK